MFGYSNDNIQVDDLYECLPEDRSGHVGLLLDKFVSVFFYLNKNLN